MIPEDEARRLQVGGELKEAKCRPSEGDELGAAEDEDPFRGAYSAQGSVFLKRKAALFKKEHKLLI